MSIEATKSISEKVNSDQEVHGKVAEAASGLSDAQLDQVAGGADAQPVCYLKYKLDRAFVKSWSVSGDAD